MNEAPTYFADVPPKERNRPTPDGGTDQGQRAGCGWLSPFYLSLLRLPRRVRIGLIANENLEKASEAPRRSERYREARTETK
jgi:hypothetical protein